MPKDRPTMRAPMTYRQKKTLMKVVAWGSGVLAVATVLVIVGVRDTRERNSYKWVCPEGTIFVSGWSYGDGRCIPGSRPQRVPVE